MSFYDNYNFEGLKLLSKINENPSISEPCTEILQIIRAIKQNPAPPPLAVAEIGIGVGATALQIVKLLGNNDVYYCLDFKDSISSLVEDFQSGRFDIKCKIIGLGNSHDEWDSYNVNLSNMIFLMRQQKLQGIFDIVYLDGAHTFLHDGLAVCLLKELIKVGGFLILDDLHWSYSISKFGQQYGVGRLPKEQMDEPQVLRVQEIFLSNDPHFEKLTTNQAARGVFRKVKNYPSK